MDFTREPIIETVITPKEGCKLVVRSSKSSGQEEYFVDSVEVVSFGNSFFFRSLERPKSFLVPSSDYEILEVREARMVLKNVGLDRSIKIGGGREAPAKITKDVLQEKAAGEEPALVETGLSKTPADSNGVVAESRVDKKRDRRRNYRRRRGREESSKEGEEAEVTPNSESKVELPATPEGVEEVSSEGMVQSSSAIISSILPPPPTLISETIARYKDNVMFKGAFFVKDADEITEENPPVEDLLTMPLPEQETNPDIFEIPAEESLLSDDENL